MLWSRVLPDDIVSQANSWLTSYLSIRVKSTRRATTKRTKVDIRSLTTSYIAARNVSPMPSQLIAKSATFGQPTHSPSDGVFGTGIMFFSALFVRTAEKGTREITILANS